jgi:hypothetical protein
MSPVVVRGLIHRAAMVATMMTAIASATSARARRLAGDALVEGLGT